MIGEYLTAHVFLIINVYGFFQLFSLYRMYIQLSTLCDIRKQRVDSVIHIVTTLTIFE